MEYPTEISVKKNPRPKKMLILTLLGGFCFTGLIIWVSILFGAPPLYMIKVFLISSSIVLPLLYVVHSLFNVKINKEWIKYIRFYPGRIELEHGNGDIEEINFEEVEDIEMRVPWLFKSDTYFKVYYTKKPSTFVGPFHLTNARQICKAFKGWKNRE